MNGEETGYSKLRVTQMSISIPNGIPPFYAEMPAMDRIPADETFDGTWPFAAKFFHGNGFAQHYIDEGEGDPIVLLHGEPMWGYLYRSFIPALSKTHRVIVPDHMGFGKSATPQDKEYCLRTHVLNLIGLLDSLSLKKKITFFVQDWGALIGLHYALRFPDKIARIMLGSCLPMPSTLKDKVAFFGGYEPASDGRMPLPGVIRARPELRGSPTGTAMVPSTLWFPWVLTGLPDDSDYICPSLPSARNPNPRGRTEQVLLNMGSTSMHVIGHLMGIENKKVMNSTWVRAYSAPFPNVESCIGALNFPMEAMGQLSLSPEAHVFHFEAVTEENVAALKALPIQMVVGRKDRAISVAKVRNVSASYGDCPYVIIENAGHFIQEDAPETIVALLQMFIQSTGGAVPAFESAMGVAKAQ